jgi:dienelactone hydrolase
VSGTRARRALAVCAVAFVVATPAGAHPFPRFTQPYCARHDFIAAGTSIRAELCRATTDSAAGRAVVVLHGCGGFDTFDHRLADTLPREGISTLYVDYFAPTPPPGNKGWCSGWHRRTPSTSHVDVVAKWAEVVVRAVENLDRTAGVAPAHVGLVGWSLGGGLAVGVAEDDGAVHAVAAFSTGLFGGAPTRVRRMPPLLLLSGGKTDAIPLAWTLVLYHAARAAGTDASLYVYPRGSHSWPGRQGSAGIAAAAHFLRAAL